MCIGHGYWPVEWMWMFPFVMPVVMLIIIFTMLYFCFGRGRCTPRWRDRYDYPDRKRSSDTALDILKERYARGEVTKDEFEKMKKDLMN